jgi:hypothetical protein
LQAWARRACPRLWEFPGAVQDFWARAIEPHRLDPAIHDGQAIRDLAVATSKLNRPSDPRFASP